MDVIAAGTQFYDLFLTKGSLASSDLYFVSETWECIYMFGDSGYFPPQWYKRSGINRSEYCVPGAKISCLETPARNAIGSLKSELKSLMAVT